MNYRDVLAESLNRPTYKVLDKKIAFDLAQSPNKLSQWLSFTGVDPKFRSEQTQAKIKFFLDEAEQEIAEHKITMGQSSIPSLTKEERLVMGKRRKRQQYFKETFFLPIKEVVKVEYGERSEERRVGKECRYRWA